MNSVVKSLALPGLSLIWLFSHAAEAQTNRDTIVVSTGYLGGGWTERRGRPPLRQFETSFESFRDDSLNVTAGLLIHTGQHVGINAAVGANPGTASLSVNLRF